MEYSSKNVLPAQEELTLFEVGTIVDGKYKISSGAMQGGMSAVFRADCIFDSRKIALKVPLPNSDYARSDLSFNREADALGDLSHPNIVQILDKGTDAEIPYLALEWLSGGDMTKFISERGQLSWGEFYEEVGRKLLQGLVYAHKRRWAHRDLKPQNVLFDQGGNPKITDFGISRKVSEPQLGLTFYQSGSPPYTPPELDDGYRSDLRDVYSWSALAVSCLSGKLPRTRDELLMLLEGLRETSTPKHLLRQALDEAPANRPPAATIFLADLDAYHASVLKISQHSVEVFVKLRPQCLSALKRTYSSMDDGECADYILNDINSVWTAYIDHAEGVMQLYGATLRLRCRIGPNELEIEQLLELNPDRASELREEYPTVPGVKFHCAVIRDIGKAASGIRTLVSRLDVLDNVQAAAAEAKRRSYWFDCWADFLREKERLYKVKQRQFFARRVVGDGELYIATIDGDFRREELGPSLVMQTPSGKPLIFMVIDVQADQIRMTLRSGKRDDVKSSDVYLQTNFEAERKSLGRQRSALEDIRAGNAVSATMGSVLSDPATALPPEPAGLAFPAHLSRDKLQVLDKAMEVQDLLVVNGPPGTGKTTLIAELIDAYLKRYPNRRILLASQTHVALDHIIAKLDEKSLTNDVVRIVSHGMENVHKISKAVEHLTLERKVKDWCLMAESRAEKFMESLASSKGISAFEVKVELLGRSYVETKRLLSVLQEQLDSMDDKKLGIDAARLAQLSEGEQPDPQEIVRETEYVMQEEDQLRANVESLEARLNRIVSSLDKLGDIGLLFRDAKDDDLGELLDSLVTRQEAREELLPLVRLHLEWLTRLGSERSFHGAVLREARIVAGTCIGLASTPAFQDDSFDLCIIDEASKATATETIVPMSRSQRTILVGDPKQLPPFIEAHSKELGESAFTDDSKKSLLSILLSQLPLENIEELVEQRRMCWTIGELVSYVFYENKLTNVRDDVSRSKIIAELFPRAVTWHSTSKLKNRRETEAPGKTFENGCEVQVVIDHLKEISRKTRKSRKPVEIAVLAAYSAQVSLLRDRIAQEVGLHAKMQLEVNTVDAFQGREADICLYSVTRSNDEKTMGFQREKERLNVALSRARDALVIIGDAQFCFQARGANPFKQVIEYMRLNSDFCSIIEYD